MDLLTGTCVALIAFVTMFLGALSGGVGLVTRPLLIFLGYPSDVVVGTSRASSIIGELPGVVILSRSRARDWKMTFFLVLPVLAGTVCASLFAIHAQESVLRTVIGIIVILMAIILIFKKRFGEIESKPRFYTGVRLTIAAIGTAIISFFSTLSGGLGQLYSMLFIWLYGRTYIGAAAIWRVAGYMGSVVSSILFLWNGLIDWQLWLVLSISFMLGSYFGMKFNLKKGDVWVKYTIIVVAVASAIKLLFFS